jgi:hypothetical protein
VCRYYEDLKRKVKASGKRDDVTALLLYTKGQQLLDQEQFDRLAVGLSLPGVRVVTGTWLVTGPGWIQDLASIN